jgi:hypothetical protein
MLSVHFYLSLPLGVEKLKMHQWRCDSQRGARAATMYVPGFLKEVIARGVGIPIETTADGIPF